MTELHIITGGKGGVGKTLATLCAAISKMKQGEWGIIIDLNYNNNDLSAILEPVTIKKEGLPLGTSGFDLVPIKPIFSNNATSRNYLIFPNRLGKIFGRLPWEGGLALYRHINNILRLVADNIEIEGGYQPSFCIVDTGLHLSNLNPQAPEATDYSRKKISEEFDMLTSTDLKIWFLWTIAMFDRAYEADAARATIRELGEIKVAGQPWFKDTNIIHVINPHAIFPKSGILNIVPKIEVEIEALVKLRDASSVNPITFSAFNSKVGSAIKDFSGSTLEKYFDGIAKVIAGVLGDRIDLFSEPPDWTRPRNVFPIPYYKRDLVGYTDTLEHKDNYTLQTITDLLGNVLTSYNKYLQEF